MSIMPNPVPPRVRGGVADSVHRQHQAVIGRCSALIGCPPHLADILGAASPWHSAAWERQRVCERARYAKITAQKRIERERLVPRVGARAARTIAAAVAAHQREETRAINGREREELRASLRIPPFRFLFRLLRAARSLLRETANIDHKLPSLGFRKLIFPCRHCSAPFAHFPE